MPRIGTALPRQRTALVVAVGLLLATAGCLGAAGGSFEDPDAVAQQVESRHDALDGYSATVVRTVSTDTSTRTTRATVTVENPDYRRVEYHTGPRAGEVSVTNATAAPVFSPTTGGTTPATYGSLSAHLVRGNDLEYLGRTELDGRRTAVVSLTPANATGTDGTATLLERRVWVDTDRLVPLRVRTTWETADGNVTETIGYRNVSLRTGTDATATGTEVAG